MDSQNHLRKVGLTYNLCRVFVAAHHEFPVALTMQSLLSEDPNHPIYGFVGVSKCHNATRTATGSFLIKVMHVILIHLSSFIKYAIARLHSQVYGTQVTMNVWDPKLQDQSQFSLAQLWILNGPDDQLNSIEAGWHVMPQLYGDSVPRLFVYWTADGYKSTGCYDLKCPGFVQVSRDLPAGFVIQPSSTYDGNQEEITLQAFKDPNSGDWWLKFGDTQVGYWPKSLFTSLADSGSTVEWGGEVYTLGNTQSPQMGSGHFPDEGFRKACYMRKLMFVDNTNTLRDIPSNASLYEDVPQCYKVIDGGNLGGDWGRNIYFGGPGGC